MTYEQKIRFLESYQTAKINAEVYCDQIADLRETMLPGGLRISDMPKHPSYEDQMAAYAGEFWEISRKLEKAQQRMIRVVAVINQIAESDPAGHKLLTEVYINGKRKCECEDILNVSKSTRIRIFKRSIAKLRI